MRHIFFKGFALLNFALGLAFFVWLACAGRPAMDAPAAAPPPAAGLGSLAEVVACVEGQGGVRAGACIKPAKVEGLSEGGRLNDSYFAASKAAVPVMPQTPAAFVDRLAGDCRRRSDWARATRQGAAQGVAQAQAPAAAPLTDADVLACVLADVERRTQVQE